MNHYAAPDFWACYELLPLEVKKAAEKAFDLLKSDPQHPSLHFKKVGEYWPVRAGLHYRAVGHPVPDGVLWFSIGTHAEYDKTVG